MLERGEQGNYSSHSEREGTKKRLEAVEVKKLCKEGLDNPESTYRNDYKELLEPTVLF